MRRTAAATALISRTGKHAGRGTTPRRVSTYTQVLSYNGRSNIGDEESAYRDPRQEPYPYPLRKRRGFYYSEENENSHPYCHERQADKGGKERTGLHQMAIGKVYPCRQNQKNNRRHPVGSDTDQHRRLESRFHRRSMAGDMREAESSEEHQEGRKKIVES